MYRIIQITLLFVLVFCLATSTNAASYYSSETGTVAPKSSDSGPVYVSGDQILVEELVKGDFVAAGNGIWVRQSVDGSAVVAASKATIDASIQKSARIVAGEASINSEVMEDVSAAVGTFTIGNKARIHGDVHVLARTLVIDGVVEGSVYFAGKQIKVNGSVMQNVKAAAQTVHISDSAYVAGNLEYESPTQANIAAGTVKGNITHHQSKGPYGAPERLLWAILSPLLIGTVLILLARNKVVKIAEQISSHYARSILVGILTVVITPILVLILMFGVITIPLALAVLALYCLLLWIAMSFALVAAGAQLLRVLRVQVDAKWHPFVSLAVGIFSLLALHYIPVVGPMIIASVWILTLGTLIQYDAALFRHLREQKEL